MSGPDLPRDKEGFVVVTVADIVQYLQTLPQNAAVVLDHDGWMESEIKPDSIQDLIKRRNVFHQLGDSLVFIQN